MKQSTLITLGLLALLQPGFAQYEGWKHSGSLNLLTTPDGANLPATAEVQDFPVLVRLDKDWFDFKQAKDDGSDLRFSSEGKPLAFQIEQWDAAQGAASIWVRIPKIKGNDRQKIEMHWGKADAVGESNGKAVFNESNGYLSVWHMGDEVQDEVGSVESENVGTTATMGRIGTARRLAGRQGISGGEKIANYPTGSSPHSSEMWMRPDQVNGRALAWGNEHGQGKVVMHFQSPPHVKMECYFSGADVSSEGRMPLREWIHVMHTYEKGDSKIYVNGELNNVSQTNDAPLAIKTPARLYIGGWYANYDFVGDIEEVRISKVVRSADWIRLQHENQKAQQTLVGPLVQTGDTFAVSPESATVLEGKSAAFSAQAGGAQKIYWILKSGDQQTIAAVDRFTYTFDAGRVTGDKAVTLQCRAVYANEVRTKDIAISIKEEIPEPEFTLTAPAEWNGRDTIEVVPQVTNRSAMQAKGAGDLQMEWSAGPIAVIKEISADKLILKRSQNSGKLTVTATIHNGGKPITQTVTMNVREPKSDTWAARAPGRDEKPMEGQFYARDDKNEGTLFYNGTLPEASDSVFLKLYANDKLIKT